MQLIVVTSLVTKKLIKSGSLIHRYFFQWSDRTVPGAIVLRMVLLHDSGKVLTSGSIQLPKAKATPFQAKEDGEWVTKTMYDQAQYFYLDDVVSHRATKFRCTPVVGLFKKVPVTGVMDEKFEDLSMY